LHGSRICSGEPAVVVDGNVARVLSRLHAIPLDRRSPAGAARIRALAERMLARAAPGDFNQALMELGATVCTPRAPLCPACPLRTLCRARALGLQGEFPEPKRRRESVDVTVAAALIEEGGKLLFVRRAEGRLLGKMWEVPQTSLESRGREDLVEELRRRHGLEIVAGELALTARHAITYRRIRLLGYRARLGKPLAPDPEQFRWASCAEVETLAVSSLSRKIVREMAQKSLPLE
jgi:A/G-specific adenine glycosylase